MRKVFIITDLEGCPVKVFSDRSDADQWLKTNVSDPHHRERHYDIGEWLVDESE